MVFHCCVGVVFVVVGVAIGRVYGIGVGVVVLYTLLHGG